MTVAASRVSLAVLAVFVLLTLTFLILAIGNFNSANENWIKLGGWVGILTAIAAWYASFAGSHQLHVQADRPADVPPLTGRPADRPDADIALLLAKRRSDWWSVKADGIPVRSAPRRHHPWIGESE